MRIPDNFHELLMATKRRRGRPRDSNGSLSVKGRPGHEYWFGEWWERRESAGGARLKSKHMSANLGFCSETTEQEARDLMRKAIRREKIQHLEQHPILHRSLQLSIRNGTAVEMLACADLFQQGYEVYKSLCPSAKCDLLALKDGRVTRVEVKMTELSEREGLPLCDLRSKMGEFDTLIAVTPAGKIFYFDHDAIYKRRKTEKDGSETL